MSQDFFGTVLVDWQAIAREGQSKGLAVNVDDSSPYCRMIQRGVNCLDEFERALEAVLARYRRHLPARLYDSGLEGHSD